MELAVALTSFVIFLWSIFFVWILSLFVLVIAVYFTSKANIARQGVKGENTLRKVLKNALSDEYTGIFNVPAIAGDIDCVLVGPLGVYAIDAKHHKGTITYAYGGWNQLKVGRGGTAYHGKIGNPSRQMMGHIHFLKGLLQEGHRSVRPPSKHKLALEEDSIIRRPSATYSC